MRSVEVWARLLRCLDITSLRGDLTWKAGVVFSAIFLTLLCVSFSNNVSCLFFGLDGTAWSLGVINAQAKFRNPFTQTGVDPFQGSFDAYFPAFREYLLPNLPAMIFGRGHAGPAMTYFIYAALLVLATYAVGRAAGLKRGVALFGGTLVPLLALPVRPGSSSYLYPLYSLNPFYAQIAFLVLAIVAALWARGSPRPLVAVALALIPAACVVLAFLSLTPYVVLMVLPVAFYGVGSLIAVASWKDRWPRVLAGLLMVAIPAALGMVTFAYGLNQYGVYTFFPSELESRPGGLDNLYFASNIYHQGWIAGALLGLAVLGALAAARQGDRKLRCFAWTYLACTATYHIAALGLTLYAPLSRIGPSPIYFEVILQPFSVLFAAVAVVAIANEVLRQVARLQWARQWSSPVGLVPVLALVGAAGFLVVANAAAAARGSATCSSGSFFPLRSTPITERLQSEIALAPQSPFRGVVVTIAGVGDKAAVGWNDLHYYDYLMWQKVGNDHRSVGLWRYDIPTLFQYWFYITPPYYLVLTDFLARPSDQQVRSVVVVTKPDAAMLKLWGARFLITDGVEKVGKTVVEMPVPGQAALRLEELEGANVGDYSPTVVRRVTDYREGLAAMHDAGFDPRRVVIADSPQDGSLVAAERARLTYETYGFNLKADSAGSSILVLPVQFSRCWSVSGDGRPVLFRANLMQLGVRFSGRLDARLVYRYGPLLAGGCRIGDLADASRLGLSKARMRGRPER